MSKINWPEDHNWTAQNATGRRVFFKAKPFFGKGIWESSNIESPTRLSYKIEKLYEPWEDTLQRRAFNNSTLPKYFNDLSNIAANYNWTTLDSDGTRWFWVDEPLVNEITGKWDVNWPSTLDGSKQGHVEHLICSWHYTLQKIRHKTTESEEMSNELNVNINQAISLLDESYKTVKVCFSLEDPLRIATSDSGGYHLYTYKVRKDVEVKPGHIIIVNTASPGSSVMDLSFAQIISVQEDPDLEAVLEHNGLKWVVDILDTTIYEECQDRDKKARGILLAQKRDKKRAEIKQYINDNYGTEGLEAIGFNGGTNIQEEE